MPLSERNAESFSYTCSSSCTCVPSFLFLFHQGYVSLHLSLRWCFFMCSRYTEHCVPFTLSPHLLWIKLDQKEAGEWGQCTVSTPSENNGVWRNTVMNIVNCHTHKNSSKFSSTQPILQGCKNTFTHSANFITVQISNLPPNAYIIQGIIPFFFRSLVSQVQTDTVWIVPAKVDVKLSVTLIPSPVYRCSHVTTPLSFESSVVASLLH